MDTMLSRYTCRLAHELSLPTYYTSRSYRRTSSRGEDGHEEHEGSPEIMTQKLSLPVNLKHELPMLDWARIGVITTSSEIAILLASGTMHPLSQHDTMTSETGFLKVCESEKTHDISKSTQALWRTIAILVHNGSHTILNQLGR